MELGDRIAIVRRARRITQQELGDKVGLFQNRISEIENNRTRPTEDQLAAIKNVLSWPPEAEFAFDILDVLAEASAEQDGDA